MQSSRRIGRLEKRRESVRFERSMRVPDKLHKKPGERMREAMRKKREEASCKTAQRMHVSTAGPLILRWHGNWIRRLGWFQPLRAARGTVLPKWSISFCVRCECKVFGWNISNILLNFVIYPEEQGRISFGGDSLRESVDELILPNPILLFTTPFRVISFSAFEITELVESHNNICKNA